MKKGVELAMNTIIIAALALLVLVILILVFTGGFGKIKDSIWGISAKTIGKGDCILIGTDGARDSDGDGYVDDLTYKVKYKGDEGKYVEIKCQCDIDSSNAEKHMDASDEWHKKYC